MENMELDYEKANKYVWEKIKGNSYPNGHPFNQSEFKENDFIVIVLSMIKLYLAETDIIDDYIDNKLKALDRGGFNSESYFQGLNEVIYFYYLFMGCLLNDMVTKIVEIRYENFSVTNHQKKLEYTFLFDNGVAVCVEIKTITCDPIYKEKNMFISDTLQIKKYFHDVNLNNIENLENYKILEVSSHDRQLRKNIKKISEKFDGENRTPLKLINMGVVFIQFATSIEEFYAYLLNSNKGIIYNQDFGNLDCLVFFSMTGRAHPDMQDVYDTGHTFTILLNDKPYVLDYLKKLRLDNYIARKIDGKVEVEETILKYAEKEYGIFRYIHKEGICFYAPIECSQNEIDMYIKYLKGEVEYPQIYDYR